MTEKYSCGVVQCKIPAVISVAAGIDQLSLIKEAKKYGYSVVAIDKNENAIGFTYADEKIIHSTSKQDAIIERLVELSDKYNYVGVLARTTGQALFTSAAIADFFSLAGLEEELVSISTQKSLFREWCVLNGFPVPGGEILLHHANTNSIGIGFPLIVKPDFSVIGKQDICMVTHQSKLSKAVDNARSSSGNGIVEVEEYIEGFDVSCLFVCENGKARIITYWDELVGLTDSLHIQAVGVSMPSVICSTEVEKKIYKLVNEFAQSWQNTHAILILSLRIDLSGNVYFIELHADLGGDDIAEVLLPVTMRELDYFNLIIQVICRDQTLSFFKKNTCIKPALMLYDESGVVVHSLDNVDYKYKVCKNIMSQQHLQIAPMHFDWKLKGQI